MSVICSLAMGRLAMLNTLPVNSGNFGSLPSYQGADRLAAPKKTVEPATPDTPEGAPDPAAGEKASPQVTSEQIRSLNQALQQVNPGLEFTQDEETGWTVVKIIDRETKETIRQFPSEVALAIAHSLDKFKGVLLNQTA